MADIERKMESPGAGSPGYDEKPVVGETTATGEEKSFATRTGLNFTSFTKNEDYGVGSMELERPMKARHLNMIAIGGRFVMTRGRGRDFDSD